MCTDIESNTPDKTAIAEDNNQNQQLLSKVALLEEDLEKAKQELQSLQISYQQYRELVEECAQPSLCALAKNSDNPQSPLEQLIATERMNAIGQLAGGVAHDLNNFLTIILGYTEDLIDGLPSDSPLISEAEEILNAGLRAHDLTHKLLSVSHNQLFNAQTIDLNGLITDLLEVLKQLVGGNTIIIPTLAENLPPVLSDQNSIEQALVNLIIRARDNMPQGGRIGIETAVITVDNNSILNYPNLDHGQYVVLSISDNCRGEECKKANRMFEPYNIPEGRTKGYGLALTMAYCTIHQSGGKITVDHHQGMGSTIRMFLPTQPFVETATPEPSEKPEHVSNNELILIVDDEESICNLVKKMVENMGYRTYVTSKCHEAICAVEEGLKPDLLISDVVMPIMNGVELGERLQLMLPKLSVLLMSGYTDNVLENAGAIGKNYPLMQKPFTSKTLATQISSLLSKAEPQTKSHAEIFMLDDDDSIRMLFQRSCKKRGHNFAGAATPEEALEILAGNSFDILLVDRNLIGLSGIEALQQIRAAGFTTPAIIFTGADTGEDKHTFKALGVLKVMEKSFDNLPVFQFIENYLGIVHN